MRSHGFATSAICARVRSARDACAALCLRAVVLASSAIVLGLVPGSAGAHAIIVSAHPEIDSELAPGVTEIRLEFNSRIDAHRSRNDG